ncbi:phosphate acyltransferase PlsX [Anaerolineales bacterium HSG6]|nr:phosphate acyltransferase PlsX [Anaerolineales bacterium HSG6]
MTKNQITITLDIMGGDHAPTATVQGAVEAARDFDITVQLVGKPDIINTELAKYDTMGLNLPIIPASQVIEMDESPSVAVKNKKDASMVVAVKQLKTGQSDGFVTAGNSGGALAASLFGLGRIKGIRRPALATLFPCESERGMALLLDVGANTDVRPEYLAQFGVMGSRFSEYVLNVPNPRVGILSTGEEEDKGNQLVQEATPLLKASAINFVGNVEGKDIPNGLADVIVTDGFTGNIYLKGAEGFATYLFRALEREIKVRPLAQAGAFLARDAFRALKHKLDYREFGGGSLLGVNGVVIMAHGRSDGHAIRNAIRLAKWAAENNVVQAISGSIKNDAGS